MAYNFQNKKTKWAVFLGAALMCSACGGGGGSSSSTPPVFVNQAPTVTITSKSVISEGQPFELDASQSTDRDGDSLTYSWQQISGPTLDIATLTAPTLSLTAPLLESDEDVSFEVSVSDGALTTTSVISINLENLKTETALSEATEYGTGGPQTPTETVGDPSIYEGDKPLNKIIGLTPTGEGGYLVHWTSSNGGHDLPVSSQAFTPEGEKLGAQVDGVYLGGDKGTFEFDGRTLNRYEYGLNFVTVQSGDTLYNINGVLEFLPSFSLKYTTTRGLVDGEIDGFGDVWFDLADVEGGFSRLMGANYAPIGLDNILFTYSERSTDDADDEAAKVMMSSMVIDKFGQVQIHDLGEYESNGTAKGHNGMTVTSYADDSYLAAWSQNTVDAGYDIRFQRSTSAGITLGEQTTVNETAAGNQLEPMAVTMADGNILISWMNHTGTEEGGREIHARIVRPDGSFATDEVVLGPSLTSDYTATSSNQPFYHLTALKTNEVLLTWEGREVDAEDIRALVLDDQLNIVSNEFLIASNEEAESISNLWTTVLPDNRVIMGWYNDYPYNADREDTSHTVGFYPVGKE